MKRTKLYGWLGAALLALLILPGCAELTAPLHAPTAVANEAPAAQAQRLTREAIDEANAALTALNRTITQNAGDVWSKAQAQAYLDQSKALGARVDQAREALRLGNLAEAKNQAELVKQAILALHAKAAAEARKETQ